MMRTAYGDRIWPVAGALGAALLLVLAWFLVISPQTTEADNLSEQATAAQGRRATLQHRLAQLRQQNAELPRYQAQRDSDRQALPTTSGMSDFLRELQALGDSTAVSVDGVIVGAPSQVDAGVASVYSLPISLTASGGAGAVDAFLSQIQQVQPRAVLVNNANIVPKDGSKSVAGQVTVTLEMQVFVAGAGGGTPKPTAGAS
jgi:Tfp pilus assembly protein PilO